MKLYIPGLLEVVNEEEFLTEFLKVHAAGCATAIA
jgi:hypothetical protein